MRSDAARGSTCTRRRQRPRKNVERRIMARRQRADGSRTRPARATAITGSSPGRRARGEARRPERALPPHRVRHARSARARRVHPHTEDRMAAAENLVVKRALIAVAVLVAGAVVGRDRQRVRAPRAPAVPPRPVVFVPILGARRDRRSRQRQARPTTASTLAAFSVLTLIAVFLTAGAGEALREEREDDIQDKATLASHADSGDALRYAMVLPHAALVGALFTKRPRRPARRDRLLAIHAHVLGDPHRPPRIGARVEYLT